MSLQRFTVAKRCYACRAQLLMEHGLHGPMDHGRQAVAKQRGCSQGHAATHPPAVGEQFAMGPVQPSKPIVVSMLSMEHG